MTRTPRMHPEKVIGVLLVLAVIAGLFAAEWYFFDYLPRKAEYELEGVGPMPEVSDLGGAGGDSSAPFEGRHPHIIECQDPELGTVYTDEEDCEDARPESDTPKPDTRE